MGTGCETNTQAQQKHNAQYLSGHDSHSSSLVAPKEAEKISDDGKKKDRQKKGEEERNSPRVRQRREGVLASLQR